MQQETHTEQDAEKASMATRYAIIIANPNSHRFAKGMKEPEGLFSKSPIAEMSMQMLMYNI